MNQTRFLSSYWIAIMLASSPVMAELSALTPSSDSFQHIELSFGVGPSWYQASNTIMQVTASDPNQLVTQTPAATAIYSGGIGYRMEKEKSERAYFNTLRTELNYYYTAITLRGQTWDYLSSNAINQSFKAPFTSSRLMLDFKPGLMQYRQYASYLILGAGASWNQVSYQETPTTGEFSPSSIRLPKHTTETTAYDLGVGIESDLSTQLRLSLEYIYTGLGRLYASRYATSTQTVVNGPGFSIYSNQLLARLAWKL